MLQLLFAIIIGIALLYMFLFYSYRILRINPFALFGIRLDELDGWFPRSWVIIGTCGHCSKDVLPHHKEVRCVIALHCCTINARMTIFNLTKVCSVHVMTGRRTSRSSGQHPRLAQSCCLHQSKCILLRERFFGYHGPCW